MRKIGYCAIALCGLLAAGCASENNSQVSSDSTTGRGVMDVSAPAKTSTPAYQPKTESIVQPSPVWAPMQPAPSSSTTTLGTDTSYSATPAMASSSTSSFSQPAYAVNLGGPTTSKVSSKSVKSTKSTSATASGKSHVVKKGETLFSIAKSSYGDGNKWKKIASANPSINPNHLKVGQTIIVP